MLALVCLSFPIIVYDASTAQPIVRHKHFLRRSPRCDADEDIVGAWVKPALTPSSGQIPLNCSEVLPIWPQQWNCWERPWSTITHRLLTTAQPAHHNLSDTWEEFEATSCSVDQLPSSKAEMLRLFSDRHIYFIGDSMSAQMFYALSCTLQSLYGVVLSRGAPQLNVCHLGKPDVDPFLYELANHTCMKERDEATCCNPNSYRYVTRAKTAVARPRGQPPLMQMTHAAGGYLYTMSVARVLYAVMHTVELGPRDVLVLNSGAHFIDLYHPERANQTRDQMEDLVRVLDKLREERGDTMPHVLWRETGPQHFATDGTGEYRAFNQRSCVNMTRPLNRMNNLQLPYVRAAKVPIMRVWYASASRWHEHPEDLSDRYDCTHFCLPSGVLRHWVRVLVHHVRTFAHEDGDVNFHEQ